MGRRRLHVNREEPLPPGLYKQGRQFRARLLGGRGCTSPRLCECNGRLRSLVPLARRCGHRRLVAGSVHDDVCSGYVKACKLKPRTMRDYQRDAVLLKKGLPHPLSRFVPKHVVTYRILGTGCARHVRNELACLSAAMSYAARASASEQSLPPSFRARVDGAACDWSPTRSTDGLRPGDRIREDCDDARHPKLALLPTCWDGSTEHRKAAKRNPSTSLSESKDGDVGGNRIDRRSRSHPGRSRSRL